MRTSMLTLLVSAVLLLALGAGNALADAPAVQSAGQTASTTQSASSSATAEQTNPTNSAVDIRIGSPGDSGAVSQSNTNQATSKAGNGAGTTQALEQAGAGAGVQEADQAATTSQAATSGAGAVQVDPSNNAVTIRIHSPGTDGQVQQANGNGATSKAGNGAGTGQAAVQSPGGGSAGVQHAKQQAATEQGAESSADARQEHPSNEAVNIRIHSEGDNGSVTQSNSNAAESGAGNHAATEQAAGQGPGGGGGVQQAKQDATTGQQASSTADAVQRHPSNSAQSIRLKSPGNDGDVQQSNDNEADSAAMNAAKTVQEAAQGGGGPAMAAPKSDAGCCGSGDAKGGPVQAAGQHASTSQSADSSASAKQDGASNSAAPIRIDSAGDNGSVEQSNANAATSEAFNGAKTDQALGQQSGGAGGGTAVQAADQIAGTEQSASSSADAQQCCAYNDAGGARIGSEGGGGDVQQSNDNASTSKAGNWAGTMQALLQDAGGAVPMSAPRCEGCGSGSSGPAVQAAGQSAQTGQSASSSASAVQDSPANKAGGARLKSPGEDGSVEQSNDNAATSGAFNGAKTMQAIEQALGSSMPSGVAVQAAGQDASTGQDASSSADAHQMCPANLAKPVTLGSEGGGGSVEQWNGNTADSQGFNWAKTLQELLQTL